MAKSTLKAKSLPRKKTAEKKPEKALGPKYRTIENKKAIIQYILSLWPKSTERALELTDEQLLSPEGLARLYRHERLWLAVDAYAGKPPTETVRCALMNLIAEAYSVGVG